jgi:hypothetical protein
VQEFTDQADQLVLIVEIPEEKQSEVIEKEAIQKMISIATWVATANQTHPRDQKNNVNNLEPGEEVTLGSFLRKYANALTMPA